MPVDFSQPVPHSQVICHVHTDGSRMEGGHRNNLKLYSCGSSADYLAWPMYSNVLCSLKEPNISPFQTRVWRKWWSSVSDSPSWSSMSSFISPASLESLPAMDNGWSNTNSTEFMSNILSAESKLGLYTDDCNSSYIPIKGQVTVL